jgi:hypothetical protein
MNETQAQNLTGFDRWFRYWMPYQFVPLKIEGRKHVYLPLNRDYKPLGVTARDDFVNYDDFKHQAVVFAKDPHGFEDVWTNAEGLYLYKDNPRSRVDYFVRLDRLLSRSVKLFGQSALG